MIFDLIVGIFFKMCATTLCLPFIIRYLLPCFLRIIDSIFGYQISGVSLFGSGIGTRHQSALALGWIQPWVENESVRWSAEIGILGLLLVVLRQIWISYLAFDVVFNKVCYSHLAPMIFVPLGPFLVSGISTQPTIQGMSAIMIIFIVFRKYI